jgi:hypothetical protein
MGHLLVSSVLCVVWLATLPCRAMTVDPDSDERVLQLADEVSRRMLTDPPPRYRGRPTSDWAAFHEWIIRKRVLLSFSETNYEITDPYGLLVVPTVTRFPAIVRIHAARRIGEMWLNYVDTVKTKHPPSPMPWGARDDVLPLLDNLYSPPEMQKAERALAACVSLSVANAVWNDDSRACLSRLHRRFTALSNLPLEEFAPLPNRMPSVAVSSPEPISLLLEQHRGGK